MNKAIRNLLNFVEENNRQYPYGSGKYIFSVTISPDQIDAIRVHTEWPAVLELITKKSLNAIISSVESGFSGSKHVTVLYENVYYTCVVHREQLLQSLASEYVTIALTRDGNSMPVEEASIEDLINTCVLKLGGDE